MGDVKDTMYCDICGSYEPNGHMAYCKKIMDTPSTFKPETRMEEEDKRLEIADAQGKAYGERVNKETEEKLNDQWLGGSTNIRPYHYAKYKIDPWTFCIENGVDLPTGSVIKYVMRHRDKNGVEDINKAIKCLEMIREHYYSEKS